MESIGIRELRQNASRIIEAAEGGTTYRVTNHGKETGVVIGRQEPHGTDARQRPRQGATPHEIIGSGVYDKPRPAGYEEEMLRIVEDGRTQSGWVGQ